MELLAPVGGIEQLRAAVRFGADAVYGGMKSYGLRAFAGNFDPDELREATAFAHAHGIRCNVFWSDDAEETRTFLRMGIDTILTNDYHQIAKVVKEFK